MIKSAHQKHKKELIPTTSAKQLEEISELSVSLSQSQPSEGSCEGKLGLLECLMGSESLEIEITTVWITLLLQSLMNFWL